MMGTGNIRLALGFLFLPAWGVWGALPDYPLSTKEVKILTGYYTEGGKYLGGVPKYSKDEDIYTCTDLNYEFGTYIVASGGNATVCMSWTAKQNPNNGTSSSAQEETFWERCICEDATTTNAEYCAEWTCGQQDANNALTCVGGVTPCTLDYPAEDIRCTCVTPEEEFGKYCAAWTCLGWDDDGEQEAEEFTCETASPSGEYCDGWTSIIERPQEVQVSTCGCNGQWNGDGVCTYWECNERSMTLCSHANDPYMSWCNVGIAVGLWGLLGSIGAFFVASGLMRLVEDPCINVTFLGFFLMAVFAVPVVIWGGQDGATYVGIWWGAIVLIGLAYGYWTKPV
eukprot:jgi/Undpi1/12869/HiC_scaffold_7.g02536.m1